MKRTIASTLISGAILFAAAAHAADRVPTWDGLLLVASKQLDQVYLRPGADFSGYTKVLLEPTEVAFTKDWQRDYNKSTLFADSRVSEGEMQRTLSEAVHAAADIFAKAWTKGGYVVVQTPGPDVMRVKSGVLNIAVAAPEIQSSGRTHSFVREAGRATFYIEVRDSMSGALLGRAVDRQLVGDDLNAWRTSGSNHADFRRQVEHWADISVRGIAELKAAPKIAP